MSQDVPHGATVFFSLVNPLPYDASTSLTGVIVSFVKSLIKSDTTCASISHVVLASSNNSQSPFLKDNSCNLFPQDVEYVYEV